MNSSNPYQSSTASNLGVPEFQNSNSLAQSARKKHLSTARWTLIVIGLLSLGLNLYFVINAETLVDAQIKKELNSIAGGYAVNPAELAPLKAQAVQLTRIVNGIGAALGFVFIVLGAIVHMFPVVATVLGLGLYVAAIIGFALIDPSSVLSGIIIKAIIVISLIKSVQAAIAFQREQ